MIKIIECPRDAMQGIKNFIPTNLKTEYLNALLKVGFNTLDFGSFVSPKAIPQMQDTQEVLENLDLINTPTKLLAIIANVRGAEDAAKFKEITYLGYPFSISETFQQRNTNRGIEEAFEDVKKIQEICIKGNKKLVIYISMGFGNPYGDPWNAEIAEKWVNRLYKLGIKIFSLSDTVGNAKAEDITSMYQTIIPLYKDAEIGAHFHSTPEEREIKLEAAYDAGCRRFDAALGGFGGCPMAKDELVGNIATESLLSFLNKKEEKLSLDTEKLENAKEIGAKIFNYYF
jgi:hydroxymethylglutaryl-CoA lyase